MSDHIKIFEIQTYTLCDGWVNTWTISENGETPVSETFATREEAQTELEDFLSDIEFQIASGERASDEGYDASEFRIIEITGQGGA